MKKFLCSILFLIAAYGFSQTPTPTINGTPPPFTFTGPGVSQLGQTFTFSGGTAQVWPAAPGITVCTGTPCTAWGASLTAPTGTIVGTSDSQTLTNKSIAGSEINSSAVGATFGGTGIDSHSSTGVAQVAAGVWSVGSAALSSLATQAADTMVMNASASTASPTAVPMPTCTTGADLYNTTTHAWSCVSTGSTLPAFVQYTFVAEQGGSLASITSPSITVSNGDLITVSCRYAQASATSSAVTGASVTTWNALTARNVTGAAGIQMSWGIVTTPGATTFTCTPSASSASQSMVVLEFSGAGTTANASTGGTSTSTLSTWGPLFTSTAQAAATSGRTLAIMCYTVATNLGAVTLPAWINQVTATAVVGTTAAAIGSAGDMGCYYTIIPYASTATAGSEYTYSATAPSSNSTTLYMNY